MDQPQQSDVVARLQAVYDSLQEIISTVSQQDPASNLTIAISSGFDTGNGYCHSDEIKPEDSIAKNLNKLLLRSNRNIESYNRRILFLSEELSRSERLQSLQQTMIAARDRLDAATMEISDTLAEMEELNRTVVISSETGCESPISPKWYQTTDLFILELSELHESLEDNPIIDSRHFKEHLLTVLIRRISSISCAKCTLWDMVIDLKAKRLLQALEDAR